MGIFYSTVYAEGGPDRMSALRKLAYRALVYFHYSAAMVYIASQKLIRYEFSFFSSLVSRRQSACIVTKTSEVAKRRLCD